MIEHQIECGALHACEKCATSKEERYKVYRHAFMMCPMVNSNWLKFLKASAQLTMEEQDGYKDNIYYDNDFSYILESDDDDDDVI